METSRLSSYIVSLEDIGPLYERVFPLPATTSAAVELARALSVSPPLIEERAVVAVKEEPPTIAILGDLEVSPHLIHSLTPQVMSALHRARYVDYSAVEYLVERLADRLLKRLGPEVLAEAHFMAIPRGGHVVLGLLSYALGLRPAQLEGSTTDRVVVVDDCAVSGFRFKQTLTDLGDKDVVFATLLSHGDLRTAIERSEPRVVACVSGEDLVDTAEQLSPDDRVEWRTRWEKSNRGYWTGQTEHLVFPWSEVDVGLEDRDTGAISPGWHIAPPSLCMHHRAFTAGYHAAQRRVQIVSPGEGEVRLTDSALYASVGNELALLDLDSGQTWKLGGVAADMWAEMMEQPSLQQVTDVIAAQYDIDRTTISNDLAEFVDELRERGLVEIRNQGGGKQTAG